MKKYQATYEGHIFKRNTNTKDRAYTHAVICTKSVEMTRQEAEKWARSIWRRYIEETKQLFEAGEEAFVAKLLAEHDACEANYLRTKDGLCFVWCQGWCDCLDLALKLAGSVTKNGIVAHIVEAVEA